MRAREFVIAAFLVLAGVGSGGFIAAYFTGGNRLLEGVSFAGAGAMFCAAALGWAFWIVPQEHVVDEIEEYPSPTLERVAQTNELAEVQHLVTRPVALTRLLYAALGAFGLAAIVPLLRSLGPDPDKALFHTKWRAGSALVRIDGSVVRIGDLNVHAVETVFPQHAIGDPLSIATLIRLPPGAVAGAPDGYVVYSRVCTHAGCPVALYRKAAEELICPCHQSAFNVLDDGAVMSGPADHPLPRLPIASDARGILRATGDFPVPVGPGFWER
jgi:ubiquinol-cytochrome c reductase iron-sulfur subunit